MIISIRIGIIMTDVEHTQCSMCIVCSIHYTVCSIYHVVYSIRYVVHHIYYTARSIRYDTLRRPQYSRYRLD